MSDRYTVTWNDRDTGTPRSETLLAVSAVAAERHILAVAKYMDTARNVRVSLALDDEPTLTQARAREVHEKNRGFHADPRTDLTNEEHAAVHERWNVMRGSACWNDAFMSFVNGDPAPVAGA